MPQDLYNELLSRLASLRRRREHVALGAGLASGLAAACVVVLAAIVAEMLGHFPIVGRTWLFWSALVLSIAGFLSFALAPMLVRFGFRSRATDDELATKIGTHYPSISDRLVNVLQLVRPLARESEMGTDFSGSPQFAFAAFQSTYSAARDADFNAIVDDRPLKRSLLLFFLSILLGAAFFIGAKSDILAAASRLEHFGTFYQKPAPFTFVVFPGNERVMRGDSVTIRIATIGEQLQQMQLRTREEGQKEFDAVTLTRAPFDSAWSASHGGHKSGFLYVLLAQHPVEYFAEAREIESDRFQISVLDHPIVRSLNVEVDPPAYTRIKAVKLAENIGDVAGVVGTRGIFRIAASAPLKKAEIVFTSIDSAKDSLHSATQSHKSFELSIEDSIATGAVTFLQSGSYHVDLLDENGVASDHPIEYNVSITKDQPPEIVLMEPNNSRTDLPNNQRLEMLARIRDDFGFRGVRLGYRLSKSKYLHTDSTYTWINVPLPNYNTQELDVPYVWNLTPLSIGPEDEVSFVMEVTDNDAITGPKSARTSEYTVRVPSVAEIFKKADEQADESQKNLNEIKQDAQDLQKKVDATLDEMKQLKSNDLAQQSKDFSKQQDMQQMLQRQNQLNDRIDQVAQNLQEMTQSLDQQNALSPETMKEYKELQDLFKQIDSPELKKAMENLQHAMDQHADPKQLEQAMQNMKQNEEQFRKSIERTENILKKIQAEQKVDELMKAADELAKQEQQDADNAHAKMDSARQMTPDEKAAEARKQQDAQKELDRMREQMKDVAQQMKKLPEGMQAPQETKDAADALADPTTDQQMQEAAQDMQSGEMQQGAQASQSASKKMQSARQKLSDLKQKMSESQKQAAMRQMKQIQNDLNRLSQSEEQLKNESKQAQSNSNVFRDLAEEQAKAKDELGQTASKTMELAQKSTEITPEMGKDMGQAFANMQQAEDAMTERNPQSSQQNAQNAMSALNQGSSAFQKAMQKLAKNGQSGNNGQGGEGQQGSDGEGSSGSEGGDNPGSGGPGGQSAMQQFINQINQMAQRQQALNQQMQGMMGKSGGGQQAEKELQREQAQMSRLEAEQQAMKKSLEQMADEQRKSQTGLNKSADDLRKIAEDMQQSIGDMKSNGMKQETIQRQERILSRLLQAEHSVHERDRDQERESKPGEDVVRESPRQLDIQSPEAQKELHEEILNNKETGFTPDYNALVRKYFEKLEQK
ncbi:MAG TPA: DUF4175 family protein [Candidatus Kapabacteria bacterium]